MRQSGRPDKGLSKYGMFHRLLRNCRLLFPLLKDYWSGNYREVSPLSVIAFIATLIYLLCPFDLILDFVPGVGQIDDALVFALCLFCIEKDLTKYQEGKNKES
jgi:uncharacterized membrane protein YkvA (DUF1232 family)